MKVSLIEIPYHLGRENVGVAKGPAHVIAYGLERELEQAGFDVERERVVRGAPFENELDAITQVNAQVAAAVRRSVAKGAFPMLLCGNCNASLGAIAALDTAQTGVVWFDAHGDFNTPGTSPSGFLDGMVLAIATGRCYGDKWRQMGASEDLPDRNLLLAGIRDLDDAERKLIEGSDVIVSWAQELTSASVHKVFADRLQELASRVDSAYLHLDIDAMDPEAVPGVEYQTPKGISPAELDSAIRSIGKNFAIKGAAIASFSPEHDREDKTVALCAQLVRLIVETAREQNRR